MTKILWLLITNLLALAACAQSFEVSGIQEMYKGAVGETLRAPLKIRNTGDKVITIVMRRTENLIGTTQKTYFCIDDDCTDPRTDDFQVEIAPNHTYGLLQVVLEGGLAAGPSHLRYLAFNKANPSESLEFDLNFSVEERAAKADIYSSREVILRNVYPNPVQDYAYIDYALLNEEVKAKIVIHNILGAPIERYDLPAGESRVKIRADGLSAGIYFYTLYLDNDGVITRKLIVKK